MSLLHLKYSLHTNVQPCHRSHTRAEYLHKYTMPSKQKKMYTWKLKTLNSEMKETNKKKC